VNDVEQRLAGVRDRIRAAARAHGRDAESVRLVAVSKTKPEEAIRRAYAAGQRDFGENYVQEMAEKAASLSDLEDLRFHFIGHLQRNKAKVACERASVIQTVDSTRLAEELAKRTAGAMVPAPRVFPVSGRGIDPRLVVFVEVNVGGEAQKSGCSPSELAAVLGTVERSSSLVLGGLMTVPPHTEDPADSRPFFDALSRLRSEHGGPSRLPELSMGMSHDLEHAIAAGATIVRVGTAIFGER
jgi:pyridoxal phosphate enzyme (YggS family)